MKYLGRIRGMGVLKCKDKILSHAEYEFERFLTKPDRVSGDGEIRMPSDTLREIFGRTDLHILTDDGKHFNLRFSEKKLPTASDSALVNVTGYLQKSEGRH